VNLGFFIDALITVVGVTTPILLAATGELVVEKSGVLNLGIEGMMLIGAVTGWRAVPGVLLLASVSGALIGLPAAMRSGRGMQQALPFGVFLGIGFLGVLFFGHTMAAWYLTFLLR